MQHIPPSPRSSSSLPVARSYVEIFVCELIIKIHAYYVTWLLSSNHSWCYVYAVVYCLYSIAKQVKQHELNMHYWDASSTNFFSLSCTCVCDVYVSMCVYVCVLCVRVSVRMCMSLRTVWPHSSFSYISAFTRHVFFIPQSPPLPTYSVVFTLSIIIRSSCTCNCFSSSSLSFEKIPSKSMHTFVSKLHPPPTLHAKEGISHC